MTSSSKTGARTEGGSSPSRPAAAVRRKVAGASKIRLKELPVFSRMIAAMLDAGIPLVQSLGALEEQTQSKMFRSVIRGVRLRVEGGAEFSVALREYPEVFDELYCSMMRAGEAGGLLSEISGRVAKYLESSAKLRRKVKSAMMYPIVVLCLAVVITTAMILFLVPVFADIYSEFGANLPKPTQMLVSVSNFLKSYFLYAAAFVALVMFVFKKWRQSESGAYMWDRFILKIPLIGELASKIALGRFASTFAQLIHSGVPILESLDIVSVAVGNKFYGRMIQDAKRVIEGGELLSTELARHPEFPRVLVHMLSAGERTGKMDEMLQRVSDFYEDEVETALAGLTATIEPLLMVILGVIVGSIVLAMFMPLFKMTDILKA
ncbi:MAG: type II secretion system F family protein [Kiritimatiellae bacterium]|nr:type II secretion system F family protein [Kiritimatiellia bacterium]